MYETDQIYELQSRKIPGSRDFAKSRPVSPGIENSWSRWSLFNNVKYDMLIKYEQLSVWSLIKNVMWTY